MKIVIAKILVVVFSFGLGAVFAWVPMLAWNLGIVEIFPTLPTIDYWTAFWLSVGLAYITTKVITIENK